MKETQIAIPTLALIAVTRGMLGFGAGLLASDKIPAKRRTRIGWTLLGVGVASTVPLAIRVWRASR
jgi:hypothetical protein